MQEAIAAVVRQRDLGEAEMESVVGEMMSGEATDAQIGGFLAALAIKGESVDEMCGAARALRNRASAVRTPSGVIVDTCGTGGDARGTFNVSTTAALIVAGAGVRVAKHGNRAMSGTVGGADVFEALGVHLDLSPGELERCLETVGIVFLFAPRLHPAMARVGKPRRELGIRTIFNLIGPLANPAGVRHQLVGVSRRDTIVPMATALARLGSKRAVVVHGRDGMDEVTLTDSTDLAEIKDGEVREGCWTPADFGFEHCMLGALRVDGPAEAAAAVREVLEGRAGPRRNVALANAAAALYVAGRCDSPRDGVALAAESVDSGKARAVLEKLVAFSNAPGS